MRSEASPTPMTIGVLSAAAMMPLRLRFATPGDAGSALRGLAPGFYFQTKPSLVDADATGGALGHHHRGRPHRAHRLPAPALGRQERGSGRAPGDGDA